MDSYDQKTETTVDIYVSTSGTARISVESFTDENLGVYDVKDVTKFTQTVLLNAEQSKALYDQLKKHFEQEEPALPEEPKGIGVYMSRQGHLLKKFTDNDWAYSYPALDLDDEERIWSICNRFTSNWDFVVKDLGADAFPLKRITQRDVIALAQSKSESEE